MKVSFVLPAYNEEAEIERNVLQVYNYARQAYKDFEIIVIDDGSTDGTLRILEGMKLPNLIVDTNGTNLGPGAAFRKGFARATGDVVVSTESDLSYPVADTEKLIAKLNENYDIVLATPHVGGAGTENTPLHRALLSRMGTCIYSFFVGRRLTVYSCFFRAYKGHVIKKLSFKSNGFESQVEILWQANKHGYKMAEVPSRHSFRADRPSKFNIPRELGRHLKFLCGILLPGNMEYLLKSQTKIK